MTRWSQIKPILAEALDLPAADRGRFVDRACGANEELRAEVHRLLAGEPGAASLFPSAWWTHHAQGLDASALDLPAPAAFTPGTLVGPYRLVREIAHGGMGTVYLAERQDEEFRRTVAIKLLRRFAADADLVRRFRAERQILAAIDHPHVAKLYDGGTTADGQPFLVMEHVDGTPIDEFCDERRLTISDRLQLFRKVCAAVQVAHQNMVIHRDLKPANILVTPDGEPKLLDFGIAKVIGAHLADHEPSATQLGMHPMTPEYASPEQARGAPVTTASDVYSLGVLLYELTTGRRPYVVANCDLAEMIRIITEQEPVRPSAVVSQASSPGQPAPAELAARRGVSVGQLRLTLRGDLDNVIARALQKDSARRYPLVEMLAQDIEHHLERRPVHARPDTWTYRTTRFGQRHRAGVSIAACLVVLLAGFSVFAVRARDRAEHEAAKARAINEFLQRVLGSANAVRGGNEQVTVREALDAAAAQAQESLGADPLIEAAVRETIGITYVAMGLYDAAERQLLAALDTRVATLGDAHAEVVQSRFTLGLLSYQRGRLDEARARLFEVARLQREVLGERHPNVARTVLVLGVSLEDLGDGASAERCYREAIEIYRQATGGPHPSLGRALEQLATLLSARGSSREAEPLFREALTRQRALKNPDLITTLDFFAAHLIGQGTYDEAERLLVEEDDLLRARYGKRSLAIARSRGTWGRLRWGQGRKDEAVAHHREAFEMFSTILGPDHVETAHAQVLYGESLLEMGRRRAAEPELVRALAVHTRALGPEHPATTRTAALLERLRESR